MNKCIGIVIPTYNERDNIISLLSVLEKVLSSSGFKYYITVVDDNSPDGTASAVREYSRGRDYVDVIIRPGKLGLGSAIKTGLEKLLENPCITHFVTIDADFSHNPADLPRLLSDIDKADVVIGSRYVKGGEIVGWSLKRRLVSKTANLIVRVLYRTGLRDHTSNYRVYSRKAVEYILKHTESSSYEWVIESIILCKTTGLKIVEKPVRFVDRSIGKSKLRIKDIVKWFLFIVKYRINSFKRGE